VVVISCIVRFILYVPRGLLMCGIVGSCCFFFFFFGAFIVVDVTRFGHVFTPSSVRMYTPIGVEKAV